MDSIEDAQPDAVRYAKVAPMIIEKGRLKRNRKGYSSFQEAAALLADGIIQ